MRGGANPIIEYLMFGFFGIYVILVVLIVLSRTMKAKRKAYRIMAGFWSCGFLVVVVIGLILDSADVTSYFIAVPVFAAFAAAGLFLSPRAVFFCDSCGKDSYKLRSYAEKDTCPNCGHKLR